MSCPRLSYSFSVSAESFSFSLSGIPPEILCSKHLLRDLSPEIDSSQRDRQTLHNKKATCSSGVCLSPGRVVLDVTASLSRVSGTKGSVTRSPLPNIFFHNLHNPLLCQQQGRSFLCCLCCALCRKLAFLAVSSRGVPFFFFQVRTAVSSAKQEQEQQLRTKSEKEERTFLSLLGSDFFFFLSLFHFPPKRTPGGFHTVEKERVGGFCGHCRRRS